MRLTDAFAMLGVSVVVCAGLLSLLGASSFRVHQPRRVWMQLAAVTLLVTAWIPIGSAHIPIAAYIRGITSDFSITLVVLAAWRLGQYTMGWPAKSQREQLAVMATLAFAAVLLYPSALGWGDWDAYRPGWGSWGMLLTLAVLCVVCFAWRLIVLPALAALALLAWSLGLMESGNLWDYLMDPWLSIFALGFVFIKCTRFGLSGLHKTKQI